LINIELMQAHSGRQKSTHDPKCRH